MRRRDAALSLLAGLAGCGGGGGGGGASASTPAAVAPAPPPTAASPYPDYNTSPKAADATGMADNAQQIAQKLRIGLNIGNTLEAVGGKTETYWGNPRITREFVQFAKASGFNAVRLPVSWNQYADAGSARIEAAWLARVREVVQYCLDADLHVVLNIHWDGGWLEENVTPEQQVAVNHRQRAFWQQIATTLRDFDGRLLFASANEPNVKTAAQMAVLMSYHQTFIDAVRATGGRNAWRTLVVQGPSTDVELTSQLMTGWPTDTVAGRLMAEIHYYTPWNFTGMTKDESWGNQFYYWGQGNHSATDTAHNPTWGEEATLDTMMGLMKARFIDRGIPVIVGEYGALDRSNTLTGDALALHRKSRAAYCKAVTQRARAAGLVPFYWDTGGLLDRSRNQVLDAPVLTALMDGAR
ncbi:glycoside hydrolase family 5 protein [Pelomonas sp. UHG3]|uniref:Glycoside hydrolase family 5 protein n=1 Tax=Roseateles hydrophilus TaxID=2975054 RepID=A0ACC6CA48_9BURK|nr:glycoside hydrolase family 5 protein [Pelomonas sp. UHG3]MCY4745313.1 glycoside hydrolase family 5 protein [Pelomonas sp. UHG3]